MPERARPASRKSRGVGGLAFFGGFALCYLLYIKDSHHHVLALHSYQEGGILRASLIGAKDLTSLEYKVVNVERVPGIVRPSYDKKKTPY